MHITFIMDSDYEVDYTPAELKEAAQIASASSLISEKSIFKRVRYIQDLVQQ